MYFDLIVFGNVIYIVEGCVWFVYYVGGKIDGYFSKFQEIIGYYRFIYVYFSIFKYCLKRYIYNKL